MKHPSHAAGFEFLDLASIQKVEQSEILVGLRETPKKIHPKYLYDQEGSALFDQITECPDYYLTRKETWILKRYSHEIASYVGPHAFLLELGAGSSSKTRILLQAIPDPLVYIPVDISKDFLMDSARRLSQEFPRLQILPIAADYLKPFFIPRPLLRDASRRLAFFPGSTFGNFEPDEAWTFLKTVAGHIGKGGLLLIGIDLVKDPAILEKAYNDSFGITAAFNLNLLKRMNREFKANFNLNSFAHKALYNRTERRIEMYLFSLKDQLVQFGNTTLAFKQGETIHTENSYKFERKSFEYFIDQGGFSPLQRWNDPEEMFAVYLLEVKSS
jgi:dimethylhistidine N-methyltransferase